MDSAIHGKCACLMCRERHPLRLALESGDVGCGEQGATEATEGMVAGAVAGEMTGEAGLMGEKDTEEGAETTVGKKRVALPGDTKPCSKSALTA